MQELTELKASRKTSYHTNEEKVFPDDQIPTESIRDKLASCRLMMGCLICLCEILANAMRNITAITMVCMIKESDGSVEQSQGASVNNQEHQTNSSLTIYTVSGEIEWDKQTQGYVLSAYFLGYLLTQAPSGAIAGRFGGKKLLLIGFNLLIVATVLTPVAARFDGKRYDISAALVIILRIISGMASGVLISSLMNLIGQWYPLYERSIAVSVLYTGDNIGNILDLSIGGFLCEWKTFDGGWPLLYYFTGGLSVIFSICWWFIAFNSPADHPRISNKELRYISYYSDSANGGVKNKDVPWRQIVKSPAVWAVTVTSATTNFGLYFVYTKLPAYMKEVLGLDIESNGLYSTLPYIAMIVTSNPYSVMVDYLRQKQVFSTVAARKLTTILTSLVPVGFLIGLAYISADQKYLGIVCMTAAVMLMGLRVAGHLANLQDIAARYAGEIHGITNTFTAIAGIIVPSLVNALTPNGTAVEWRSVFYMLAAVQLFGGIFFLIFARGETQHWAKMESEEENDKLIANTHE